MKKTLFCILFLGFAFTATAQEDKDHNFTVAKNLDVLNVIYKHLDLMYVDSLNGNEVIGNGINAMLQSLDPYTVYYPEEKVKELKFMITGKYGGIGSVIRYNNQLKRVIIDQPYEHMPAAEVGLKNRRQRYDSQRSRICKQPFARRPRNELYLKNQTSQYGQSDENEDNTAGHTNTGSALLWHERQWRGLYQPLFFHRKLL